MRFYFTLVAGVRPVNYEVLLYLGGRSQARYL